MHSGMDRPLPDWDQVRHRFRCISRQQLASTYDTNSCNRLRGRHSLGAILYYATFIWIRSCWLKGVKSYAGKTS